MRRADMIPLALLAALAGAVGFRVVRQPSVARTPPVAGPSASAPRASAADPVEPRTLTIVDSVTRASLGLVEAAVFTPGPESEEILRRMRYGASGTFILEMVQDDSVIVRWPERETAPIRVWVESDPSLTDWDSRYAAAVRDGFNRWTAAEIPVRMNFVRDSADAEVWVRWTDRFEGATLGRTHVFGDRHFWLGMARITIALHGPGGAPLTPADVHAIAAHEAGHMLGLGHSPNEDDIMASGYGRQVEPSGRDLMTMRVLYTIRPGRFR